MANISHANFASLKLPNKLEMEEMEVFLNPYEDHVVVTIPFNHATKEGSIFFTCPLDRNSDCTSTILLEHATKISNSYSLPI